MDGRRKRKRRKMAKVKRWSLEKRKVKEKREEIY